MGRMGGRRYIIVGAGALLFYGAVGMLRIESMNHSPAPWRIVGQSIERLVRSLPAAP
jgi:hypothetical protein